MCRASVLCRVVFFIVTNEDTQVNTLVFSSVWYFCDWCCVGVRCDNSVRCYSYEGCWRRLECWMLAEDVMFLFF